MLWRYLFSELRVCLNTNINSNNITSGICCTAPFFAYDLAGIAGVVGAVVPPVGVIGVVEVVGVVVVVAVVAVVVVAGLGLVGVL